MKKHVWSMIVLGVVACGNQQDVASEHAATAETEQGVMQATNNDGPVLFFDRGDAVTLNGMSDLAKLTALLQPYGLAPIAANGFAQTAMSAVVYRDVSPAEPAIFRELFVSIYAKKIGEAATDQPSFVFTCSQLDSREKQKMYKKVFKLDAELADLDYRYAFDGSGALADVLAQNGTTLLSLSMKAGQAMQPVPVQLDTTAYSLHNHKAVSYHFSSRADGFVRPFDATSDAFSVAADSCAGALFADVQFTPTFWLLDQNTTGQTWAPR